VPALSVIAATVPFGAAVLAHQPARKPASPTGTAATGVGGTRAHDVLCVPKVVETDTHSVEPFTMGFIDMTPSGGKPAMWCEKTVAAVAFTVGW